MFFQIKTKAKKQEMSFLSPEAAIRLATLRIQDTELTDEEQAEIIQLEQLLTLELKRDPTYRLPNVFVPCRAASNEDEEIENTGTYDEQSKNEKKRNVPEKVGNNDDDSDSYDHFDNTTSSVSNNNIAAKTTTTRFNFLFRLRWQFRVFHSTFKRIHRPSS